MTRLLALLIAAAFAVGCGGDDEKGGGGGKPRAAAGPAKTSSDAQIAGSEGKKIAAVTAELLNAKDGSEACFAIVATDYVDSVGGPDGCAAKLGPIVLGPYDTITAARPLPDGESGESVVESRDGARKQTIRFAKTSSDDWRIDGLGPR